MTSLVESYYGFKKPPFTTSESSGPVFMTEPLRAAAHFVRNGLEAGTSIQCVSGHEGIGKSSFARALPKLCADDYQIAVLSGRTTCWDDMRRVLLREFGIRNDRITRDGLEEARQTLGKLLIVVDDAHYLSPELLERVCILPQLRTPEGEPVAQVLLLADLDAVGRDRIRPLLAWLEKDVHHAMTALEPGEAHAYLDTRLRRVGWEGHPLINEAGAAALHRLSLGNPRKLSELSMRLLEYAASRGVTLIDGELAVACLADEKGEEDEASLASTPGTELCGEEELVLEEDWQEALASAPLTAEAISGAPSLELAAREPEPVAPATHSEFADSPPLESIRAVYRPPAPPEYISRYREPKGQSKRTLVFLVCAALVAVVMYTSKGDLGTLLAEFGMPFSFASERIDAISEIDRVGAFEVDPADEPDLSTVLYDELSAAPPSVESDTSVALVTPSKLPATR